MNKSAVVVGLALAAACGAEYVDPTLPDPRLIAGIEQLGPDEGFSFSVNPFDVPPGSEVQDCFFMAVPDINNGEDVWIDHFKLGQRAGSHHLNVFRVKSIVHLDGQPGDIVRGGECRISSNWADWPLVVNSQESKEPVLDWVLPTNVAQRFRPGELLMVQSHYVNADLQITPNGGEFRINFYKSSEAAPQEMGTLFATQQSIRICQSAPVASYIGGCALPGDNDKFLVAANGHFHTRGKRFSVYTWDGLTDEDPLDQDRVYESTNWAEPEMAINMNTPIPGGGGIRWQCEYKWSEPSAGCDVVNGRDPMQANDCCYTFGNTVESSEHCNVFAYYYPKAESDAFCQ
jgi:hypothetical protein